MFLLPPHFYICQEIIIRTFAAYSFELNRDYFFICCNGIKVFINVSVCYLGNNCLEKISKIRKRPTLNSQHNTSQCINRTQ